MVAVLVPCSHIRQLNATCAITVLLVLTIFTTGVTAIPGVLVRGN